jgi:hypothetical protein
MKTTMTIFWSLAVVFGLSACGTNAQQAIGVTSDKANTDLKAKCDAAMSSGATWDATNNLCTCQSPKMFDTFAGMCISSTVSGNSYLSSNPCTLGQLPISGMCTPIANITEQQGCQATQGQWTGATCVCPSGLTYQPSFKSCQQFGAGTSPLDQACLASGGQPNPSGSGMCLCPTGYTTQTQTGSFGSASSGQYCSNSMISNLPVQQIGSFFSNMLFGD